ncbi:MAG: LUD domain-containing protein [Verrucomicrobia bacterium]|jgi:L-lactate dehydrogenase complex protein LldG|nr:LUD domain-containing protein [Verrucomicrobiota bacterium]
MTSRERILGRIREALRVRAPVPGHAADDAAATMGEGSAEIRQWLPRVGATWEQQRDLFAQNSAALKTEFKQVSDAAAASAEIQGLAEAGHWRLVAAHRTPLLEEILARVEVETLWMGAGPVTDDLEICNAGVTTCEALVAQTGSVLVTSLGSGGRALSVLPPHHLVIARREQLVPDLPAAFALLREKYGDRFPSMISFITGPSRTGDIERILVLGAHGPKRLTVLLC